jgi:hypothetical protein
MRLPTKQIYRQSAFQCDQTLNPIVDIDHIHQEKLDNLKQEKIEKTNNIFLRFEKRSSLVHDN